LSPEPLARLDERGSALVLTLASMTAMMGLAGALVLLAATEGAIAARYRDGTTAFYAAEAALEQAVGRLRREADWTMVVGAPGEWRGFDERVSLQDAGDGLVRVRAAGVGPAGARRTLEVVIARSGTGVRIVTWRERR
jgi:hypothetical protein